MFSKRLRELRKAKRGLTQSDMAKYLGIAKTTYASYEQGKRMPDIEIQNKIADYFEVTLDYLHGRDKKAEKPMTDNQRFLASLIDEDTPQEIIEEIVEYIDYVKHKHAKSENQKNIDND